jgi:hypothetical protein
MSQYHKAMSCEADNQFGECVARLNVAFNLAEEAEKFANSFVLLFSPSSTQLLCRMLLHCKSSQNQFQRLIPYSVHESASLYSEEKAKIVRG